MDVSMKERDAGVPRGGERRGRVHSGEVEYKVGATLGSQIRVDSLTDRS